MVKYKKEVEAKLAPLEAELKGLEIERDVAKRRRQLKREILANKIGRATDIMGDIWHGAKSVGKAVSSAYTPQSQEKVRRMRKVLLNE